MIIDFHTHVFPPHFRENRADLFVNEPAFEALYKSPQSNLAGATELVHMMDAEEIQQSVIFGFPWQSDDHYRRNNDYIIESIQKYPDRLKGFCCFSVASTGKAREVERCLKSGLMGVGELAVYDSGLTSEITRSLSEVMSLCADCNAPLLLHVNEPVGHLYPGKAPITLSQIYHFLKSYPENRIILAHWGGGLFFYALMKKEVRKVLEKVWFDTAASPYLYLPEIYRIAGQTVGFEKILFGSDYPLLKPSRYFKEMAEAGLTSREMALVKGLNAAGLLEGKG